MTVLGDVILERGAIDKASFTIAVSQRRSIAHPTIFREKRSSTQQQ